MCHTNIDTEIAFMPSNNTTGSYPSRTMVQTKYIPHNILEYKNIIPMANCSSDNSFQIESNCGKLLFH